jgi:hypothetical protein
MYRQDYMSQVLPYRLPEPSDYSKTHYNDYLMVPPRIYKEELSSAIALYQTNDKINLLTLNNYWLYPGYVFRLYQFSLDGSAISFDISNVGSVFASWTDSVTVSYQGTMYRAVLGNMQPMYVVTNTATNTAEITTGPLTLASFFGVSQIKIPLVDSENDIIAMKSVSGNQIEVHTLSTGALLRIIKTSGTPVAIAPGSKYEAYVLCSNNIVNVININTGKIIGTSLMPRTSGSTGVNFAWDAMHRRLLTFENTGNNADGSSTSKVRGYYPVPIATKLTAPIPLTAPRAYRETRIVARVTGDVGEPIAISSVTGAITATPPATAVMTQATSSPDGTGYAELKMLAGTPGTIQLDASVQVTT